MPVIIVAFMVTSLTITGTFDPIIVVGFPLIVYTVEWFIDYFEGKQVEEPKEVELEPEEFENTFVEAVEQHLKYVKTVKDFLRRYFNTSEIELEANLLYDNIADLIRMSDLDFLKTYFNMKEDDDLARDLIELRKASINYEAATTQQTYPVFKVYVEYEGEKVLVSEFNLDLEFIDSLLGGCLCISDL